MPRVPLPPSLFRLVLCALAAGALVLASPPAAVSDEAGRTITVTGSGTASARPDRAHIETGVVSEAETARAALEANTEAMSRVVAALKEQGVAPKDIQTRNFSVRPRYRQSKDNGDPPAIAGYRVVNSVRIAVRDLDRLGAILDKVVTQGSNEIGGIRFSVAEPEALTDKAREAAMADARRKAELYAAAADARLGEVRTIDEQTRGGPPRPLYARDAAEAQAVPIEPGEHSLEVSVSVTWALE